MRKSIRLNYPAALDDTPCEVDPRNEILRRASAGNDATCEDLAIVRDDAAPWSRHAFAANGFGDVATIGAASSARPTSEQLIQAARAHRATTLGKLIGSAIRAAGAMTRRAHARYRQRGQARAIYEALRQLDDRTLHDLGFDRSEIWSVAAEATGEAEHTRAQVFL